MCRLLGTPSDKQWPGVSALRDWHVYPQWEPQNLARAVPALGPEGVDLLEVSCFCLVRVLEAAINLFITLIFNIVTVLIGILIYHLGELVSVRYAQCGRCI